MEISTQLINENEITKITNIYSDIENNFKESININPKFKNEIQNVYSRAMLNVGRATLSLFHLRYLEMFEELSQHYGYNEELHDLSVSLTEFIDSYFKELNDCIDKK